MAALLLLLLMLFIIFVSSLPHSLSNLSPHCQQQKQQELLLQFKSAVSNNDGSLPDWTPTHHFCNWTGVTCHSSSHSVRAINLTQMSLTNNISPVLGNLSSLRSLDLSSNYLSGTIPPALSACQSLYFLSLSYNQLHGSIPPELTLLTSLNYLYLSTNTLTGTILPSFKNLSALVILDLDQNNLSGTIPPELGMLSHLQALHLLENNLSGTIPISLTNLSKLNELALFRNSLSGHIPWEIGTLSNLVFLYLWENQLSGHIPNSLGNCSHLEVLNLSQNQINGNIPWKIGIKLSNLVFLLLWGNQLTGKIPNSLGNCSRLEGLALNKNHLGGLVPMEIGTLNRLTRLYLHSSQLVTDSSNTLAFFTALTNCSYLQEIGIHYNYFTSILPASIGQLYSNLNKLGLSENMISGNIPQQIVNLTNLTYLDLGNNLFSGNIPSGIRRFSQLERFFLAGNKLEGSIPSEIGELQHLGLLNLSHNKLSGKIPDSLCNSQQLRQIYLQHNNLSGKITVSLEGCQKLELLDLSYNKLGGRIPGEVIASLKNLQFYLNLSWNSLQGSLPQELSKIVMAQAIDISGNQLSGIIPNSVGDCTALEHLNLSHNAFVGPIPGSLSKLKNLQDMDLSFNNLTRWIPEAGMFPNRSVVTLLMGNPGLCGPKNYSLPPCLIQAKEKHSQLKIIVSSVVGSIAFVFCFFILVMLLRHKFSRQLLPPSNIIFQRLGYPKFSYQELVIATSDFDESNLLGVGNFGSVYKGILRDGKIVAIKTLTLQNEEAVKSFKRECKVLGRIRHRNLIRITSAFFYPDLKGLVLEFACNGSLDKHLHPQRDAEDFYKLGLGECLSISIDVAHGMEYLHHDCPLEIVHCDLKPSNVLLNANMTALVTDFGISRLTATNSIDSLSTTTFALKGSIGYISPEYGVGGNVSAKGDVYGYGIMILEMVTRKRPSDEIFVGDMNLHKWVRLACPDRLADIVDSELLKDVNESMEDNTCLLSFIHIGLLCSAESARERPSMRDVAKALERVKKSSMGDAAASNLTASISDLLRNTNPA